MLEQMGGIQFRFFSLTSEHKRPAQGPRMSADQAEQDAGWDFILKNGEMDKSGLKQLRWIHTHISAEGSPIKGWPEKLVQRALDQLTNEGCLASLTTRYDLTIADVDPQIREELELIVPYLLDHSIWLLGEPGVGKTPLARSLAMMLSRYHGGDGSFRSASDFDFFWGSSLPRWCRPSSTTARSKPSP